MRFITSIFMLLTAVTGVISAYFVGHGLVVREAWPFLTAGVLLVASALLGFVYLRLSRGDPQPVAHGPGHDAQGHGPDGHGTHH